MMAGTVAFAAPDSTPTNYTISVNANTKSTYKVYQLLTGKFETPAGETEKVIYDAVKGSSVKADTNVDEVLAALVDADGTAKVTKDSVDELKALVNEASPITTLSAVETSVEVPLGYYLVIEEQNPDKAAILKIVDDDLNIASKLGGVTFEKKLKDINDTEDVDITDNHWQDGADHDIGDAVPFQLKATLPENVDQYEGYYLKFTDNLNDAFDVSTVDNVVVKVGDEIIDPNTLEGSNKGYDWAINTDLNSFTLTFPDIKHVAEKFGTPNDAVVTVEYTAVLGNANDVGTDDDKVTYGNDGNENTAHATYSNNPDFDMYPKVDKGDDVGDTDDTGDDDTNKPDNPEDDETTDTANDTVVVFTYKTVINKVDEKGDPLDGAEFQLSKKNTAGDYEVVGTKIFEGTVFTFYGLDDGDYRLEEVTTPSGYKGIDPIDFTVVAEHDGEYEHDAVYAKLNTLTANNLGGNGNPVTGDVDTGTIATSIENTKTTKLPETGGIGTKLFYAIGGGLTGLAGIALITKKRMSKKN